MDKTPLDSGTWSPTEGQAAEPDGLLPGQRVDHYQIKEEIGIGGMGRVYLARDEKLGRLVALKWVRTDRVAREKMAQLVEEAKIIARFNHPHIIAIHDTGEFKGVPYLVLEYLSGSSLRARMEEKNLSPKEIYRIGLAVAQALQAAHRGGVVHADLKPENIFIPHDGRVRVLDFGLAAAAAEVHQRIGTQAYLAPERWRSGRAEWPSDIWALGVTLYEMMESRRPFWAPQGTEPKSYPQPEFKAQHPPPLQALVLSCLQTSPADRPTAETLVHQLETLLSDAVPRSDTRPFRGLASFEEHHAAFYFGRDAEIARASELLRHHPILPLVGPSGAGKSSFVQAGLIPRLRESGDWEIIRLRPGSTPIDTLAARLHNLLNKKTSEISQKLQEEPGYLGQELTQFSRLKKAQILLFVDQLEELFTLDPNGTQTEPFLRILSCTNDPSSPVRVCFTLREDFLPQVARYEAAKPALGAMMSLLPMNRAQLASTITEPLRLAKVKFESPGQLQALLNEIDGHRAALPLLQFALDRVWDRRDIAQGTLPEKALEEMGGVVGALAQNAEQVLQNLLPEERPLARRLIMRLVTPDGLRCPRSRDELLENAAAGPVLERLIAERLLVTRPQANPEEIIQIELAHEALIAAWPTLAQWRDAERAGHRLLQEIETGAQLWWSRGQKIADLWTGEALLDSERRLVLSPVELPVRARKFIEASRLEHRRLRRRKLLSWGAFVAAVLFAIFASFISWREFQKKERQTQLQKVQIDIAAADIGTFYLKLRPFDWDPATQAAQDASGAILTQLRWRLYRPKDSDRSLHGQPFRADQVRVLNQHIDSNSRTELVEASGGPAFIEITGRGTPDCAPSIIPLQSIPGYARRADAAPVIELFVPSCAASRANMVEIPAGPFIYGGMGEPPLAMDALPEASRDLPGYLIDRTEVTNAAYQMFARMARHTGEPQPTYPEHPDYFGLRHPHAPVTGLNAFDAAAYCRFLGKRLPTDEEWLKAGRGGLTIGGKPNPFPRRNYPSGLRRFQPVRQPSPVGQHPEDWSPYGVADLAGNVTEWTQSSALLPGFSALRATRGGPWPKDAPAELYSLAQVNARDPRFEDYTVGVRCAQDN